MASFQELQELRLRSFIDGRIVPAVKEFEVLSSEDFFYATARGEIFEAVWLLHLGVELEYFPAAGARSVFEESRDIVYRDFSISNSDSESLFAPRLYLWLREMNARPDHFSELDRFERPLAWHGVFTSALMLSDYSFHDRVAQAFLTSVTLLDNLRWASLREEDFSPEAMLHLLRSDLPSYPDISPETLFAGFFRSLEQFRLWQDFFTALSEQHPELAADRGVLRDRIGQMQVWRLNMRNDRTEKRMHEMAKAAKALITSELTVSPTRSEITEMFTRIDGVIDDWKSFHRFYLEKTGRP